MGEVIVHCSHEYARLVSAIEPGTIRAVAGCSMLKWASKNLTRAKNYFTLSSTWRCLEVYICHVGTQTRQSRSCSKYVNTLHHYSIRSSYSQTASRHQLERAITVYVDCYAAAQLLPAFSLTHTHTKFLPG